MKEKVEPFQPMDKKDSHHRTEEARKKFNLGKYFLIDIILSKIRNRTINSSLFSNVLVIDVIFFLDNDLDDYHRRAEEAKKKLNKKICDTLKIPLEKPKLVNSPTKDESMIEALRRSMGSKVSFKVNYQNSW